MAVGMTVLLDCIADIYGLMSVDMLEIWSHIEGYGIYYPACAVVFEL